LTSLRSSGKKLFGEYGVFTQGKMFAVICDNQFFMRPTEAGRSYIGDPTEAPPYPGAKNYFLIEEKLEDRDWLSELIQVSLPEISLPRKRKKKR